jgi:hypothetical protein
MDFSAQLHSLHTCTFYIVVTCVALFTLVRFCDLILSCVHYAPAIFRMMHRHSQCRYATVALHTNSRPPRAGCPAISAWRGRGLQEPYNLLFENGWARHQAPNFCRNGDTAARMKPPEVPLALYKQQKVGINILVLWVQWRFVLECVRVAHCLPAFLLRYHC